MPSWIKGLQRRGWRPKAVVSLQIRTGFAGRWRGDIQTPDRCPPGELLFGYPEPLLPRALEPERPIYRARL